VKAGRKKFFLERKKGTIPVRTKEEPPLAPKFDFSAFAF